MTATRPVAVVPGASRASDNSTDASNRLGAAPRDRGSAHHGVGNRRYLQRQLSNHRRERGHE